MKIKYILIIVSLICLTTSCQTYVQYAEQNMVNLTIGMTKDDVKQMVGDSYYAIYATQDPETNTIYETWEYPLATAVYRLHFENSKLVEGEQITDENAMDIEDIIGLLKNKSNEKSDTDQKADTQQK